MITRPDNDSLVRFVLDEARCLNEGRYAEWLALFAKNGRYWIPLQGAQQGEHDRHNALADEDRLLLGLRMDRLGNARAFSQQPRSHSQHVIQTPQVDGVDEEGRVFSLYTPFIYVEARGDEQIMLAGHWRHRLVLEDGFLRIALKRVNLLNAGAQLPMIQLFP